MKNNILKEILSSQGKCLIIPHQSPDGDCLGSSFTLSHCLDRHGIEHHIIMDDLIPSNYLFLKKDNMIKSDQVSGTYDYGIILDTSSKDRAGTTDEVLSRCSHLLVIDHHKTNAYFGDTNIVKMVSSVGELLFGLYEEIDYKIDTNDAIGLYTSIVTDTGEFRYSNTTSETLKVAARIFETGFDFEKISQEIFSNQELKKVILKSNALSGIELHGQNKMALLKVTQTMLGELECEMYHSDGIVEAGRDISGIEVSVLLKEISDKEIKVSMRSKSYLDVSEISLLFGGGGHIRAAGCTLNMNLQEAEQTIIKEIESRL
ncbi:bifunctional oligoribonuclease/PAP phosphatase NrnA [Acidaminobacter sp. JC074]|uniref:DHH family phosphoesterase n=1 Tax=Acidaminobacter sp. JC074 TaxID=2530199 RepID=UPI001F0ECBAD|nr:bifunctional oligoribonuclease/PAP phosphatase NrnA [Acidaminobacter sp. JC074]MCH4890911.1 bifunctional oligoribonuclease/PAP phosphatase NrnA [Acidaminobacter sp. JC074]